MAKAKGAKKEKEEVVEESKEITSQELIDKLNKEYGNVIYNGQHFLDEKIELVNVTPGLDIALGGGVPRGSFGVLSGPEKTGKTSLAMKIASNAQKANPNTEVYFFGVENRFKKKNIHLVAHDLGFDIKRFHVIMSNEESILDATKILTIAEQIILNKPDSVIVIDSYSALATESELAEDLSKEQRAGANKILSKWFRRMSGPVRANRQIIIGITHIISNPSGYGSPWQEKTGAGIKYFCDWKLVVKKCEIDKSDDDLKAFKQDVLWQVKESALGQGGAEVTTFLVYDLGYDDYYELAFLATQVGFVQQKSSWYTLKFIEGEEIKKQGLNGVRQYLAENPDKSQLLKDKLCELLG